MSLRRPALSLLLLALFLPACDVLSAPDAVAQLEPISPTQLTATVGGTLADPLVVRALDPDGDPVEGAEVEWTATAGELSESLTTTDETGLARVFFTVGETAGSQTVTALMAGLDAVVFLIDARPGGPTRVLAAPDTVALAAPGDTLSVRATAEDEFGNRVPDLPFAFSSLDRAIATVQATADTTGLVEAVAAGETGVIAAASGLADTVVVIVGQGQ